MGIMMKFIGISKKNNAQKREHNLLKPSNDSFSAKNCAQFRIKRMSVRQSTRKLANLPCYCQSNTCVLVSYSWLYLSCFFYVYDIISTNAAMSLN